MNTKSMCWGNDTRLRETHIYTTSFPRLLRLLLFRRLVGVSKICLEQNYFELLET